LKDLFKELQNPVTLNIFSKKRKIDHYNNLTQQFTQKLTKISKKKTVSFYYGNSREVKKIDESISIKTNRIRQIKNTWIFAAGYLTGEVRQNVIKVSEGATSATSTIQDIFHLQTIKQS